MKEFDMDDLNTHEMDGYREGNVVVLNCPRCGRKVTVISGVGMVILEKGNQEVQHQRPLSLTAVLEERAPDPFEQWAEGVDIAVLLNELD